MAAKHNSSCVQEQSDVFLNNVRLQLGDYIKEAILFISKLETKVSEGTGDKKVMDKLRKLHMIRKVGEELQKVPMDGQLKKCNFYNRGFCKKGILCDFAHPVKVCVRLVQGVRCDQVACGDRHPYACRHFKQEGGCSRGLKCEFRHEVAEEENMDENTSKVEETGTQFKLGSGF